MAYVDVGNLYLIYRYTPFFFSFLHSLFSSFSSSSFLFFFSFAAF